MRNIRIPQVFTLIRNILPFLRAGGKQKIPISLGNQDFIVFYSFQSGATRNRISKFKILNYSTLISLEKSPNH